MRENTDQKNSEYGHFSRVEHVFTTWHQVYLASSCISVINFYVAIGFLRNSILICKKIKILHYKYQTDKIFSWQKMKLPQRFETNLN